MDVMQIAGTLGPKFAGMFRDGDVALRELGLPPAAKVLDVGTGDGKCAVFLALRGYDVLTGEPATDTTHYAGKDWSESASRAGVAENIRFRAFDASDLPFESGAFDAVFFFGVLHHIEESLRVATLSEALRVVRDGGAVVFFEPKTDWLEKMRATDPGHPDPADPIAYLGDARVSERRLASERMDIIILRPAS